MTNILLKMMVKIALTSQKFRFKLLLMTKFCLRSCLIQYILIIGNIKNLWLLTQYLQRFQHQVPHQLPKPKVSCTSGLSYQRRANFFQEILDVSLQTGNFRFVLSITNFLVSCMVQPHKWSKLISMQDSNHQSKPTLCTWHTTSAWPTLNTHSKNYRM